MIKAIIFDLDGTLIESEPYHMQAEIEIFAKYGVQLNEDIIGKYLGLKIDDFITIIEKRFDKQLDHSQIASQLKQKIQENYEQNIPLIPNVAQTLELLSKDYRFALATSREKHLADIVLNRHHIKNYFKHGVYREDVKHGKPHPEVFLKAAKLLAAQPSTCVVIEDAENGFKAGKQAGMRVIARKAGYNKNQDFSDADYIIQDFLEITKILEKF